jgi:hypothetical protein
MNSVRFMSVSTLLWGRSSGVLRGNDSGRYTLPSRSTYPHQWNWDSALAALGWAELDPGRPPACGCCSTSTRTSDAPAASSSHCSPGTGRAAVLYGALASRYGVRSLDARHRERSARNYWRGPIWANITWLTALGLELHGEHGAARTLRSQMMLAVEGSGMREYFAPESGRGLGARDFAWTAALCLRELAAGAGARAVAA